MHRRELLSLLAAGAASWAVRLRGADDEGSEKPGADLRIACSSLAFAGVSWERALEEIRALGFRRAELAMFEGWRHVDPSSLEDPKAHGERVRAACERLGLEPVVLHANFRPRGARGAFPGATTPDEAARAEIVDHCGRVVACARAAAIPLVNVQPGAFIDGVERSDAIANAAKTLRAMLALAKRAGVRLSVENHTGSIAERPKETLELLRSVPGLELDLDLSHAVANCVSPEEARPLLSRTAHVAIRNATAGDYDLPFRGGELAFDLGPWLDELRAAGVRASFAVEYFEPGRRASIAPLRRLLEQALEGVDSSPGK